ncbi:MAG TPA: hypothetical protein VKB54_04085 [Solirubrobacteraceae bacterium]|nr:hypothetical protein [Solirubrobacteraceae bacterium]
MTIGPEHDAPRPADGASFSDAITVAFGDASSELYGVARLGLSEGGASGLAILFWRGEPVAVTAEGGVEVDAPSSWDEVSAAGLDTATVAPLRTWRLHYAGDEASFDLELEATGALAELPPDHPVARMGGMTGYEQPVRVQGEAQVRGSRIAVDGLGQRGHSWGAPDWGRIALARTVSAWLDEGLAVSLTAIRPAGKQHHSEEALAAAIIDRGEDGAPRATDVLDPRLSTTYDGDGRQRHAGMELWVDDEGFPRRAAGEIACGTSLDLGALRLDCAFFRWRMEGRVGVGRYDVLRHA